MNDLLGDFAQGAKLGVYENIRLSIIWAPNLQEFGDFCQRIRIIKKRPVCLPFHALPDFFG